MTNNIAGAVYLNPNPTAIHTLTQGIPATQLVLTLTLPGVNTQGEYVEICHVGRPHQPTVLRWHPTKPVLALGWENGEVMLLTHPSGDQTILPNTHTSGITLLEWSSAGSRLVTGDQVSVLQWLHKQTLWNIYRSHILILIDVEHVDMLVGLINTHNKNAFSHHCGTSITRVIKEWIWLDR